LVVGIGEVIVPVGDGARLGDSKRLPPGVQAARMAPPAPSPKTRRKARRE